MSICFFDMISFLMIILFNNYFNANKANIPNFHLLHLEKVEINYF